MASVNENLNPQRTASTGRSAAAPGSNAAGSAAAGSNPAGSKPATLPPAAPKPKTPTDKALIAARPQTDAERQQTILKAVKAAQAQPVAEARPKAEDEGSTAKKIADGIGLMDGIKEGARIATSSDELARLPGIGKAVQGGTRLGKFFTAIAESKAGKAIATAFQQNKVLAPATRFLGRIAPFAGVAVAGYDIYSATKVNQDPKASTTEKVLANTKAALSGIAGVAGMATLALAPTGIGAAIAGGVALGAGLLSLGADLWLGKLQKDRKGD
jgi:hypothetical protein